MNLAGPGSSSEISVSTGCCSEILEGNKEPVPGYSVGYAGRIHDIHFYAAVSNWLLLSICIYLMTHRTEVISNFEPPFLWLNWTHVLSKGKKSSITKVGTS